MVRMEPESLHVRKAKDGDPVAFTALVRLYDPQLRAYAFHILGDRTSMDDALQNAYLNAFRAIRRFRGEASFKNWMYRIVHNACIDVIRRRRDDVELFEAAALANDPSSARIARLDLVSAFERMTTEHRSVLLLVDVHGLDYAEAADVLSVPVGTVRSRLNRARAAMRRELGEET